MESVEVYCCGEVITCKESINVCETCGAEYDIDGDRINKTRLWDEPEESNEKDIIIVNE
jgi:hypothetical protein